MGGEDLVILVGTEKAIVGPGKLGAHQQRFNAASQQHDKGSHDVSHANGLVSGVGKTGQDAARVPPRALEFFKILRLIGSLRDDILGRGHLRLSRYSISGCRSVELTATVAI